MLPHNYLNSNAYTASLVKSNLSTIPSTEIQSIKKRVDFYVNHYQISTKNEKLNSESREQQLKFLLNLNSVLENEIQERKLDYYN